MCPTCRMSKQPLAKATLRPAACSSASRRITSSRETTLLFATVTRRAEAVAKADGVAQFRGADGCGPALHHHETARIVGQACGKLEPGSSGQGQCQSRHHRVARPGDVGDFVGAEDGNVNGRLVTQLKP